MGQKRGGNAYYDATLEKQAVFRLPPTLKGSIPDEDATPSLPFPAVVGLGALAGVGSGFFVGSVSTNGLGVTGPAPGP